MKNKKKEIIPNVIVFILIIVLSYILILSFGCSNPHEENNTEIAETRDPLKWPFASNSGWNTPVGDSAVYASYQNNFKQIEIPAMILGKAGIYALEVKSLGPVFTQQLIAELIFQ